MDLFIGGRVVPGSYPSPAQSHILRNDNGFYTDVTGQIAPDFQQLGMVTSARWTDLDGDGNTDLMIAGEWMALKAYRNNKGIFEDITSAAGLDKYTGWWFQLGEGDFDKDGDPDYIAGNMGLNYKYKATDAEPFHVYAGDFDESGTQDVVLGYFNQGVCYPVRGLQCSSEQMPTLKTKFHTYHEYGLASLTDVYGEKLNTALHYEAKWFSSSYIENKGGGKFEVKALPQEAQFSFIFGIIPHDFTGDGNLDVMVAGNLFVSEVETGRADAGNGLILAGDGKGGFKPLTKRESGLDAYLDVKNIKMITTASGEKLIFVGNNNDMLQVYRLQKKAGGLAVN